MEPFERFRGETSQNVKIRDTLVGTLLDASAIAAEHGVAGRCAQDIGRYLFAKMYLRFVCKLPHTSHTVMLNPRCFQKRHPILF